MNAADLKSVTRVKVTKTEVDGVFIKSMPANKLQKLLASKLKETNPDKWSCNLYYANLCDKDGNPFPDLKTKDAGDFWDNEDLGIIIKHITGSLQPKLKK